MKITSPTALTGRAVRTVSGPARHDETHIDAVTRRSAVVGAAGGTAVVLGISGTCPYGIGACWGGAHEALRSLDDVAYVDPIPDADDSTATVFLVDERLPALDRWDQQFRRMVNGSYRLRGFEVRLDGTIEHRDGGLFLTGSGRRPAVELAPLVATDKIQWDRPLAAPKPVGPDEAAAYETLAAEATNSPGRGFSVTGPLKQTNEKFRLEVRLFSR
jgi:hypothetical protein